MPQIADLMPIIFGTGGIALLGFAVTWRRKDARDAIDTANENIDMALKLRDAAHDESKQLRIRVEELESVVTRQGQLIAELRDLITSLRNRIQALGGDPG